MQKLRLLAIGAVAAASLTVTAAQPSTAAGFSYTSGIQIVNLSSSTASVVVNFYDQAGAATPFNVSINAGASQTLFPLPSVPSGFNGSAVISSDQPVAAVVNVQRTSASGRSAYVGALQGNTNALIPLLLKQHGSSKSSTWFNIQNAGSADATVNVTYSDGTNRNNVVIKPGASQTYDQLLETHNATIFAGTVSSNQPVVVTVVQENADQMFAYSAFPAGSTNPVLPLINFQPAKGYKTGVQIQNGGNAATTVTVSYSPTPGKGTACTETQTINPGASGNFAFNALGTGSNPASTSNCTQNQLFVGSARVTANSASQPLVVVVNQNQPTSGEAYSAFDPAAATNTVSFPLIKAQFGSSKGDTGFNVMNVGTQATTVTCTFNPAVSRTVQATLQPGDALNDVQGSANMPVGYIGAASCKATGGDAKVVGVVNETSTAVTGDRLYTSEGINLTTP